MVHLGRGEVKRGAKVGVTEKVGVARGKGGGGVPHSMAKEMVGGVLDTIPILIGEMILPPLPRKRSCHPPLPSRGGRGCARPLH